MGRSGSEGTDFATHSVVTFITIAIIKQWCIFVLFVDLVKAFDKMLREIVFGFDDSVKKKLRT